MNNLEWLENIATKIDFDEIQEIIRNQSLDVQKAYKDNNQKSLKTIFGGNGKLPNKNTIAQF